MKNFPVVAAFILFCGASACFASGIFIEGVFKNSRGRKLTLVGVFTYIAAFVLMVGWVIHGTI